jgi:hypothetical protein
VVALDDQSQNSIDIVACRLTMRALVQRVLRRVRTYATLFRTVIQVFSAFQALVLLLATAFLHITALPLNHGDTYAELGERLTNQRIYRSSRDIKLEDFARTRAGWLFGVYALASLLSFLRWLLVVLSTSADTAEATIVVTVLVSTVISFSLQAIPALTIEFRWPPFALLASAAVLCVVASLLVCLQNYTFFLSLAACLCVHLLLVSSWSIWHRIAQGFATQQSAPSPQTPQRRNASPARVRSPRRAAQNKKNR